MQLNIKDIDAFREAAKEAGLKLSDHEVKVPKWYERKSYDCAVITFEDMLGKPVSVTFKDCSAYRDDEITATANRKGVSNSELVGELMRAHIEKIEGDEDQKIFAELPEENAKTEKWKGWAQKLRNKVSKRLTEGVGLFRNEVGVDEGN